MDIKLYNTLTKTKEILRPADEENVRLYVCGPTVYDTAHIGNARTFLTFDLLFRVLRHKYGAGHVTYVRNITDIDDKINARARERYPALPPEEAIRKLTDETNAVFQGDMKALGMLEPTAQPRATEHVAGMVNMIAGLIEKGHAYAADGHVLFDVAAAKDYGTLSRRTIEDMIAGARIDVAPYKKGPMDFVLWKPSSADQPGWPSPWGRGRPGWHIECSVMSAALLGKRFDIHGGGIDLVFPHHENERAQSLAAHGCEMAGIWMHGGFLQVEGEKMSKSLGNFLTVRRVLSDFPNDAVRLALLQTHYRQPLNWTASRVRDAQREITGWAGKANSDDINIKQEYLASINVAPNSTVASALYDDLNTPQAITELRRLFNETGEDRQRKLEFFASCDLLGFFRPQSIGSYFGLGSAVESRGTSDLWQPMLINYLPRVDALRIAHINQDEVRKEELIRELELLPYSVTFEWNGNVVDDRTRRTVQTRIERRAAAKKAKDFAEADRIRKELEAEGIQLKDTPSGTTWEYRR